MALFFVAPPQDYLRPEVTLSCDTEIYHANKLLSGGQETGITLFEHEQAQSEDKDEEPQNSAEQSTNPLIVNKPSMAAEKSTSSLVIKEKKLPPARSGTPTTHKTRRTNNMQGPTLADISRGFLKSVKQHAGHNTTAHNPKELALQIYASKVWNSIKDAFLIGENRLRLPASVHVTAQLHLTIDRSGKLVDIKLIYPQHITEVKPIEQLLVSRAHQAGLFPPFPAAMAGQTQRFNFPLVIQGEEGFHSYSLGYR